VAPRIQVSQEALALHREAVVVDLHVDTLLWARSVLRYDLGRRHRPHPFGNPFGNHVDLPRLREGGVDAVGLGIVVRPWGLDPWGRLRAALRDAHRVLRRQQAGMGLATTAAEVLARRREGRVAALLGVEGGHGLGGRPDRVAWLQRRGVTYLGLVHLTRCAFGHPANRPGPGGLTAAGRELIAACEAHRVLVDLAHLDQGGFRDALTVLRHPPLVSHTGIAMAQPLWRNLDLEQCRGVADRGGVIGVIFFPGYLTGRLRATLEAVVDHLEALRQAVGRDTVAIGSDLDGCIASLPAPLRDCSGLPLLTERLLRRGWTGAEIRQALGGNALRLLREVRGEACCRPRTR
jgi:membrane dipeptidase